MKKIGTITYHASYNYGSCLQAYALQTFVQSITKNKYTYKIINFRSEKQKYYYKNCFAKRDLKSIIESVLLLLHKNDIIKRENNFESFIDKYLNLTREYNSYDSLTNEKFNFDYYISGSDQLWNLTPLDFDFSYYLEFVKKGKKISYAASFGDREQEWNLQSMERGKNDLLTYGKISVRDENSKIIVDKLTGLESNINVDPTLLLSKEQYEKLIDDEPIIKGEYLFLYDLKGYMKNYKLVKKIAKKMKLKIVTPNYGILDYHFSTVKKLYNIGPIEFLNLIKNASAVATSSFHGNIFSIIFEKPLFSLNGKNDNRISTLLKKLNLQDVSVNLDNVDFVCKKAKTINYKNVKEIINKEIVSSQEYLMEALDIHS